MKTYALLQTYHAARPVAAIGTLEELATVITGGGEITPNPNGGYSATLKGRDEPEVFPDHEVAVRYVGEHDTSSFLLAPVSEARQWLKANRGAPDGWS